ncbi:MAG: succinate dehydrogenase, cytochrome b556 subunit [Gammaproteobacteria bacterium RIFCSPHIGHO2_12_FULL_63_22]|nr:MAG: succinate dehydrogenase, cytochrome b556 subunit [Gammaproteobacteria bacterium RIFCSPHIGHO2_12_FULL_63_22]
MAAQQRPLSPHLQIYRQGITGTLSILHRATGVFLGFAAFAVVVWLFAVAGDGEGLASFNACAASPLGVAFLLAATASLSYHLLNGIRHLLWDIGWGFELPKAVASGWIVVALAIVLTAVVAYLGFSAGGTP